MLETLSKHLNIIQVYIDGTGYILAELESQAAASFLNTISDSKNLQKVVNDYIENKLSSSFNTTLQVLSEKRDRDLLIALMEKLTSCKFVAKLKGVQDKRNIQRCRDEVPSLLRKFQEIERESLVVRDDMTNEQQRRFTRRKIRSRKQTIKNTSCGQGRRLKADEFPELGRVLELAFGEGASMHPRLTEDTLYKAPDSAMIMRHARDIVMEAAPPGFTISLSSLYNYTQNYKKGTYQAKRHHSGKPDVNACISLHHLPRIGVQHEAHNVHYTSAAVNYQLDGANKSKETFMVDAKDAKAIVCGDIDPVQRPGKSWRKRTVLDHSWNQARDNAVTPMTHLLVSSVEEEEMCFTIGGSPTTLLHVTRTGKVITFVNLSMYEPETAFRCLNEIFYLMTLPEFFVYFRNPQTLKLKENFIFIVDNGPSEAPSNKLVQMCIVRLVNVLNLNKCTQISYAEYHSKRNPAERPHAVENDMLSHHGPFDSQQLHKSPTCGSEEHHENMEQMAQDVISCLSQGKYGHLDMSAVRGVTDATSLFSDEAHLKQFVTLTEQRKDDCDWTYVSKTNDVAKQLQETWGIDLPYEGGYSDDYRQVCNKYTNFRTCWMEKYITSVYSYDPSSTVVRYELQPIPDFVRWLETSQLHYLSYEQRVRLSELLPEIDDTAEMFLPTRILELCAKVFIDPNDEILLQIALLAWIPTTGFNSVSSFFTDIRKKWDKEYEDDLKRDQWRNNPLYAQTKASLSKLCAQNKLSIDGPKHDLVERLAMFNNDDIPAQDLFRGNLEDIPLTMGELNKLSIGYLRQILRSQGLLFCGTKEELVLRVFLLRNGRQYLILSTEQKALMEMIHLAEDVIQVQLQMRIEQSPIFIRERKNASGAHPVLTSADARKAASAIHTNSTTKVDVPSGVNMETLHELFKPIQKAINEDQTASHETKLEQAELHRYPKRFKPDEEDSFTPDVFTRPGSKIQVKWTSLEVEKSKSKAKRPGWYTAEIQSYNKNEDTADVVYLVDPNSVYTIQVTELLAEGYLQPAHKK